MGKLFQDSGGTADSRRSEANEILKNLENGGVTEDQMNVREIGLLASCHDPDTIITPRMIFWLRDIQSKYLD